MLVVASLSGGLAEALRDRYGATDDIAQVDPDRVRVVVTSGGRGVERALVDRLPALGLIAIQGVGHDRVDLEHARARGVAVTNTPDVLTDDVADMAVALVYAAARRVAANDRFVRSGRWAAGGKAPFGRRVTGCRLGIIGLGRIGGAVARRLEPVAESIAYHNRNAATGCDYAYHATAEALAHASDIVILAASSAAGDPPIVTAAVLDALGPEGVFVNVARGSAVDEAALAAALAERRILAAGLDVFAAEPHVPPALLALDNVVLQPHQASATPDTRKAMTDLVLANIAAYFAGKALPTPVA